MVERAVLVCTLMVTASWGQSRPQPTKTDLSKPDSQFVCRYHAIEMVRKQDSKCPVTSISILDLQALIKDKKDTDQLYFDRNDLANLSPGPDKDHSFGFFVSTLKELVPKVQGRYVYAYRALNVRKVGEDEYPRHHETIVLTTKKIDLEGLEKKVWAGYVRWPSCEDGGHHSAPNHFDGHEDIAMEAASSINLALHKDAELHQEIDKADSLDAEHTPPK